VTFLAFSNGSPDVFSTFAALKNDSGSLAIGELIGAASFIVSVVAYVDPLHPQGDHN
jgi:sodium/potassium/calcium exchanger 6